MARRAGEGLMVPRPVLPVDSGLLTRKQHGAIKTAHGCRSRLRDLQEVSGESGLQRCYMYLVFKSYWTKCFKNFGKERRNPGLPSQQSALCQQCLSFGFFFFFLAHNMNFIVEQPEWFLKGRERPDAFCSLRSF